MHFFANTGTSKKICQLKRSIRFRITKELLKIEAQIKNILFTFIPTQSSYPKELVPVMYCSKDMD
jgi:hypothetical protein